MGSDVDAAVRSAVGSDVRSAVGSAVESAVGSAGYSYWAGSLWTGYAAWADYFNRECGIKIDKNYNDLAENCGYYWTLKGVVFATERPSEIHLNEDGQLHNESGPAVTYSDGLFSVWAINGVVVDEQVVMRPESQTASQITNESNEERRSIRAARFGWPRYLKVCGAEVVDRRVNDVDCTEERLMQLPGGSRKLLSSCKSTAKIFVIGVPREISTCEESQSWMAGGSSLAVKRNLIGAS